MNFFSDSNVLSKLNSRDILRPNLQSLSMDRDLLVDSRKVFRFVKTIVELSVALVGQVCGWIILQQCKN